MHRWNKRWVRCNVWRWKSVIARIRSRQSKRERSEKSTWRDTTIGGLPISGNVSDFFGHAGDCDKE